MSAWSGGIVGVALVAATGCAPAEDASADAHPVDAALLDAALPDAGCARPEPPRPAAACPAGPSPSDGPCPPAPPRFAAPEGCPSGWRPFALGELPVDLAGPSICAFEPPTDCLWPMPGAPGGCYDPAADCAAGAWPPAERLEGAGSGRVWHVAASGDGRGTVDDPAQLADALSAAAPSDVIALGPGAHVAPDVPLTRSLALIGLCPARTVVVGRLSIVDGAAVTLAGLTLQGGVSVIDAAATLSELVVRDHRGVGVTATGPTAEVHAARVAIGAPRPTPDEEAGGLRAENGAALFAEGVTVRHNHAVQVVARGEGTRLTLDDAYVGDGRDGPAPAGRAIQIEGGAHASLTRVFADASFNGTLGAAGAGTVVEGRQVVVGRDGFGRGRWDATYLVGAFDGARIELRGALLHRAVHFAGVAGPGGHLRLTDALVYRIAETVNLGLGLAAVGEGAHLTTGRVAVIRYRGWALAALDGGRLDGADVLIAGGLPAVDGARFSMGLAVSRGAAAAVDRLRVVDARVNGVWVAGAAARLTLRDAHVVRPRDDAPFVGRSGAGLTVDDGGAAEVERLAVEGAPWIGALVTGGGRLTATDVRVRRARDDMPPAAGVGLLVSGRGLAALHRARVEAAGLAALSVADGARLEVSDLWIEDVDGGPPLDGSRSEAIELGFGVVAAPGGRLAVRRAWVRDATGVGLAVGGATGTAEDVVVEGTRAAACLAPPCAFTGGIGLAAVRGGALTARRIVSEGNALAGAHVDAESQLTLDDVYLRANPLGLSAPTEPPLGICLRLEENDQPTAQPRTTVPSLDDLVVEPPRSAGDDP